MAPNAAVSLSSLLQGVYPLHSHWERQVAGITQDTRTVQPGSLFMACKGARFDARAHLDQAIAAGASAVLVEADDIDWCCEKELSGVPVLPILHLREQLAALAARFYGEPAKQMQLIGVTGTNGKTTTSQLLAQALQALGKPCGVIGTLGAGMVGAALQHSAHGPSTTPDAVQLQQLFATLREQQAEAVVMEVSSHALEQQRVLVDDFAVAIFTNLTRDHLDYHGSMESYGAAKRKLFHSRGLQLAVLNYDDEFTRATQSLLGSEVRSFTWSMQTSAADVYAKKIQYLPHGVQIVVHTPWAELTLNSALLGSFNVSNLLAVLTTVLALAALQPGFNPQQLAAVVAALPTVKGRMQVVGNYPVSAVVDYAHTPDALEKALQAVREHCQGQIWCVFGCGGERDRGKRSLMAAVAEQGASQVVLTDDNPRSEASSQILADIQRGLQQPTRAVLLPERAQAIAHALNNAAVGDVVLIAGKGHEEYQEFANSKVRFSDAQVALTALQQRFATTAAGAMA
jgi:UDP-N-acetylmuramoyl-L-alanyl-D-glutamate--2,6-diaminopimelate ligase